MPQFSVKSQAKLAGCHPDLQKVFNEVIKYYDCTIICGRRSAEEQQEAFETGHSQKKAGQSLHEREPSEAVDVAPCPVDWSDHYSFYHFAGFVLGVARGLGITLRWGGDWNQNNNLHDQTLFDLGHFEVTRSAESPVAHRGSGGSAA